MYNWTSWLDDYGFGKCTDKKKCNVFPDGKPFPQSNDWRRKSYVYVWHAMGETRRFRFANILKNKISNSFTLHLSSGQYYETCDGSSSSLTINTTDIPLGAEVMEVMVYRKRERRKYSPLTTDNTVFYVTGGDKLPHSATLSDGMFQPNRQQTQRETWRINNLSLP